MRFSLPHYTNHSNTQHLQQVYSTVDLCELTSKSATNKREILIIISVFIMMTNYLFIVALHWIA